MSLEMAVLGWAATVIAFVSLLVPLIARNGEPDDGNF